VKTNSPNAALLENLAIIEQLVLKQSEAGDLERTSWADLLQIEPLRSAYDWLVARAHEAGLVPGTTHWATTVMVHLDELEQILEAPETPVEEVVHEGDDGFPAYLPVLRLCEARIARGEGRSELRHAAQRLRTALRTEVERFLDDDAVGALRGPRELLGRFDDALAGEMWRYWLGEVEMRIEEHLPEGEPTLAQFG
jgi:hypothetical protein